MDPIRVVIADDDDTILRRLTDLIGTDASFKLVAGAPTPSPSGRAHNPGVGPAEPFGPRPMPGPSAGRATVDPSTPPSQAGPRGLMRRSHPPSSRGCRYLVLGIQGHRPLSPGNEVGGASEDGRRRT